MYTNVIYIYIYTIYIQYISYLISPKKIQKVIFLPDSSQTSLVQPAHLALSALLGDAQAAVISEAIGFPLELVSSGAADQQIFVVQPGGWDSFHHIHSFLYGFYMVFLWFITNDLWVLWRFYGSPTVFTRSTNDLWVFIWFLIGKPIGKWWLSMGFNWIFHGDLMEILYFPSFIWFLYGLYMVFIWFLYGLYMTNMTYPLVFFEVLWKIMGIYGGNHH